MTDQPTDGERFDHGPTPTGSIPTFAPPPETPEQAAIRELLDHAVSKHMQRLNTAIEAAWLAALDKGCGVRVDQYSDAGWSVSIDRTQPLNTLREYRHSHPQPFKDQDYRHPGCANCDSLIRDRHA
jgi:hypothetical protein